MTNKKAFYGITESIVLMALMYYIFFMINPLKENFLSMNIHPFLIVVVMISLRYGNYLGLFSAIVASLFYMYAYHSVGRDMYLFIIDFSQYKFLLMFFLSSVIFGRFKDTHDFKLRNAELEHEALLEDYTDLQSGYEKLKFIKEELRKRLVGSEHSIVSLYDIASTLETLDSEEIYTEVIDLMKKYLSATAISIYSVDRRGKYLRLKLFSGQDEVVPTSIVVQDHKNYQVAMKNLSVIRIDTEDEDSPLMMGPITRNGKVIAFVNIDQMDFRMVSDYSFNLFKVIIDWVNKALVQALEVEEIKKINMYYENTNIMTYERFAHRLKEEIERKEKFGLEYSILKYEISNKNIIQLDRLLRGKLREIDVVAYNETEKKIYILLPTTGADSLSIVDERIKAALLAEN